MLEQVRNGELNILTLIIPIYIIIVAIICLKLASKKNKNQVIAFILGLIPGINMYFLLYYIICKKNTLNVEEN